MNTRDGRRPGARRESSPLVVLGAARSGTTLLSSRILARHEGLEYWGEPDFVWKHGNAYRSSDVLTEADARTSVKEYIRRRFTERRRDAGADRILTKSPRNTLQVPFITEVFPDVQFVHLIRDGRDVALSASREWRGESGDALDSRELRRLPRLQRLFRTLLRDARIDERVRDVRDIVELPAYSTRLAAALVRQLTGTSWVSWGPRFPGVRTVRRRYSLLATCAIQWRWSVCSVRSACAPLDEDQYLELYYEDLIRDPEEEVRRILDFAGLESDADTLSAMTSEVSNRSLPRWPEVLDLDEVRRVERVIASLLRELGYAPTEPGAGPAGEEAPRANRDRG